MAKESSAYCNTKKRMSQLYERPLSIPLSMEFLNKPDKPSVAIRKRKGDRGSPCFKPFSATISQVGQPFTSTEKAHELTPSLIQEIHFR